MPTAIRIEREKAAPNTLRINDRDLRSEDYTVVIYSKLENRVIFKMRVINLIGKIILFLRIIVAINPF